MSKASRKSGHKVFRRNGEHLYRGYCIYGQNPDWECYRHPSQKSLPDIGMRSDRLGKILDEIDRVLDPTS